MNRRFALSLALCAPVAMSMSSSVVAQAFPSKAITVIVPFAAGGGSDNVARLIATKLTDRTGKTFVVENRGGAGTNIGNEAVARAAADGYTLLLSQFTLSVNAHLYPNLRYNVDKDFTPVAHIANAPTVLIVPAQSPVTDVAGLVAVAKAKPGKLNYGSGGSGTSVHLAGELFKMQTKTFMVHIPYKGSAPALTDLIGGQLDLMFDTATSALPHVKGGKVRAIGVAAGRRLKDLPNTPTFAEQGMRDFDVPAWYGFVAPVGTPAMAIQWLNAEVNAVLRDPDVVSKLEAMGAQAAPSTPSQFGDFMRDQSSRWGNVIRATGVKLE